MAAAATRGFTMVLFTEPVSRRNTFVGGTCAPPSALLVTILFGYHRRDSVTGMLYELGLPSFDTLLINCCKLRFLNCSNVVNTGVVAVFRSVCQLLFTSDKGGGICFRPHTRARLSVCLSVCKITQKRVHGFG